MRQTTSLWKIALLLASMIAAPSAMARKISTRIPSKDTGDSQSVMIKGSQAISTDCQTCGDGYSLTDIGFSGYDKKATSDKESFFVTNRSDRTLTGFSLYIIYHSAADTSLQLHRRWVHVSCEIPPGETQKVDISSWDKQKSFHYHLSPPSRRRQSTPYGVRFDPVTIYLRFK